MTERRRYCYAEDRIDPETGRMEAHVKIACDLEAPARRVIDLWRTTRTIEWAESWNEAFKDMEAKLGHEQLRREKCGQCTDKALAGHMDEQDTRIERYLSQLRGMGKTYARQLARIIALEEQVKQTDVQLAKALEDYNDSLDGMTVAHMQGHAAGFDDGYATGRNSAKEHINKLEHEIVELECRVKKMEAGVCADCLVLERAKKAELAATPMIVVRKNVMSREVAEKLKAEIARVYFHGIKILPKLDAIIDSLTEEGA